MPKRKREGRQGPLKCNNCGGVLTGRERLRVVVEKPYKSEAGFPMTRHKMFVAACSFDCLMQRCTDLRDEHGDFWIPSLGG